MPIHSNSLKNLTYRFPKNHKFNKGKVFTKEHRLKISLAHRGIKLSEEHKNKLSENNARYWLGRKRPNLWGGSRPEAKEWMKNFKHSEEAKIKISETHSGENHYRWNPDRDIMKRNKRSDPEYKLSLIHI